MKERKMNQKAEQVERDGIVCHERERAEDDENLR